MSSFRNDTSTAPPRHVAVDLPLPQEEQARADLYALLGRLLLAPADAALLHDLAAAGTEGEAIDQPLERAWQQLVEVARHSKLDELRDEFDALFISTSVPLINPYGSLYMGGFLHEKPLAALRTDLARIGLARRGGVAETEDHLGALCETMRVMIGGGPGIARQPLAHQHAFFNAHIAPWFARCLDDLRWAAGARFYSCVADLAEAFLTVERDAFEMAEDDDADLRV